MRPDLTDITLVVDRSGSMQAIREDAQGGVNALIQQQVKEPGEATLTLVQFDTEYEVVHSGVAIEDAPEYELVPRGATALLDAVGRAINETGKRISRINQKEDWITVVPAWSSSSSTPMGRRPRARSSPGIRSGR